jgi:hypothetical protein
MKGRKKQIGHDDDPSLGFRRVVSPCLCASGSYAQFSAV